MGTGALLARLTGPEPRHSRGLLLRDRFAFSPDGRWLALARSGGGLDIVEAATGRQRLRLATDHGAVCAVAFSPYGLMLASGGSDGSIRLWDVSCLRAKARRLSAAELETCWQQLGGADASAARQAVWKLLDGKADSLAFLRTCVRPARITADQIDKLITGLDDDRFEIREQSAEELEELGVIAAERLHQELARNPSLEVRRRVEAILQRLEKPRPLTAGERRAIRAVALIEHIGGDEALAWLKELASGHEKARLTQEARSALERHRR